MPIADAQIIFPESRHGLGHVTDPYNFCHMP